MRYIVYTLLRPYHAARCIDARPVTRVWPYFYPLVIVEM